MVLVLVKKMLCLRSSTRLVDCQAPALPHVGFTCTTRAALAGHVAKCKLRAPPPPPPCSPAPPRQSPTHTHVSMPMCSSGCSPARRMWRWSAMNCSSPFARMRRVSSTRLAAQSSASPRCFATIAPAARGFAVFSGGGQAQFRRARCLPPQGDVRGGWRSRPLAMSVGSRARRWCSRASSSRAWALGMGVVGEGRGRWLPAHRACLSRGSCPTPREAG